MEPNTRTDAVRTSLRVPRAAVLTSMVVIVALFAALASVLITSPSAAPLMMSVERINHLRTANDAAQDEPSTASLAEENQIKATVETVDADERITVEVIAEEDIRWLSDEVRYFNGRPIRPIRKLTMVVTAYSPDEQSCGKWADGITASGYSVWTNGMKLVAADTSILPFGSLVSVPGYDNENVVPVLDRGGAIRGKRLDVLYPTHERALVWGVQELEVTVWEYADGAPNGFRTNHRRR